MKEWACIELKNHKDIGKTIMEWQKNGWRLHTYNCSVMFSPGVFTNVEIRHYLLFEMGE